MPKSKPEATLLPLPVCSSFCVLLLPAVTDEEIEPIRRQVFSSGVIRQADAGRRLSRTERKRSRPAGLGSAQQARKRQKRGSGFVCLGRGCPHHALLATGTNGRWRFVFHVILALSPNDLPYQNQHAGEDRSHVGFLFHAKQFV